jgi:hypothetical protein
MMVPAAVPASVLRAVVLVVVLLRTWVAVVGPAFERGQA